MEIKPITISNAKRSRLLLNDKICSFESIKFETILNSYNSIIERWTDEICVQIDNSNQYFYWKFKDNSEKLEFLISILAYEILESINNYISKFSEIEGVIEYLKSTYERIKEDSGTHAFTFQGKPDYIYITVTEIDKLKSRKKESCMFKFKPDFDYKENQNILLVLKN